MTSERMKLNVEMLPTKIMKPMSPSFLVIWDEITDAIPAPSPGVTAVRKPEKQPDAIAFAVKMSGICSFVSYSCVPPVCPFYYHCFRCVVWF